MDKTKMGLITSPKFKQIVFDKFRLDDSELSHDGGITKR